jgi:hypothetical protein
MVVARGLRRDLGRGPCRVALVWDRTGARKARLVPSMRPEEKARKESATIAHGHVVLRPSEPLPPSAYA